MQFHTRSSVHQASGTWRCSSSSSRASPVSVPIRTWTGVHRECSCRVFAPEAASSAAEETTANATHDRDSNVNSPAAGSRQTYIQESVSFTGAELAARLPSMQAAMRARAEATAAALQQRNAALPGAASSSRSWGTTAARSAAAPRSPSGVAGTNSSPYVTGNPYAAAAAPAAAVVSTGSAPMTASTTSTRQQATDASTTYNGNSGSSYSNGATASSSNGSSSSSSSNGSSNGNSMVIPSPSNLAGLSASQKLQALQQVQAASRQALAQLGSPTSPYYLNAPKTIDVRMYDQLVVAHNKLSKKLGEANAHIDVVEGQVARANQDLRAAYELLKQIAMEFGTTSRLAQGTAAAVQFGVDPQDALDKISKLQERLSTLEQAVLEQRQEFGQRVVREVPVEWIGVASEVRVMGDFDGWTRGHELSAEDVTTDSVYSRFEGTLMLRPGTYRVKFLVDGEWRLAADWPTEDDGEGNTVCVLKVA